MSDALALQAKFHQGLALHQQGKLADAERIYREVLRQQPNHFNALHLLGVIALQTRHIEQGADLIRKAIGLNANVAIAHSNLGKALLDLKRPEEALASCDKAIALEADDAQAHNSRGMALENLKRPEEALVSYDKAIALEPDLEMAHNNRGVALQQLCRLEEALASYDKAIALKPDYAEAYYNRGNALNDLRRFDDALASYNEAIVLQPNFAMAHHNRGVALQQLKRPDAALASYDKAIALEPDHAQVHNSRGNALRELGQIRQALASYDKAIALTPDYTEAYYNRGNALKDLERLDEALASYDQAIALKPDYAETYNNRGVTLQNLKRFDDALASYDKAVALKPDYAEAYNNRGVTLQNLKRLDDARASYDRAIALKPDNAETYYNHEIALQELELLDEALASYDKAIALKSDNAAAYYNRGNALKNLQRLDDALASYDKAVALKPDYAEAYINRGAMLQELKRYGEALASYGTAIALNPDIAVAYGNRGVMLQELRRLDDALADYDKAIALEPEYADAYNNRGNALKDLRRFDEALASYDKAIALKPDYAEAHYNRGHALRNLQRFDEALASYDKAIELKSDCDFLFGHWMYTKMRICDWSDLETKSAQLVAKLERAAKVSTPFSTVLLSSSPELQRRAAEVWIHARAPSKNVLSKIIKHHRHDKIHIGYFSADYHNHPVSRLIAELFETHDRSQFEVTAFSFGADRKDEMRHRLTKAFRTFLDVQSQSDEEIAMLARKLEIDIAVDLNGFTADGRTGIFSFRAAPIQVNYLGYPGTMGAEYIDYLIADPTLIPGSQQKYYSEKLVYLPDSYQANDTKRRIADKVFTRAELGLPQDGFVFCCFNNNYKIMPDVFDCWMRIIKQVDGSVLWLLEDNKIAASNLRKEAARREIDADRLVFASRMPLSEHLARHRLADLFLDTLPYNAHTTASDALWTGLPVLTRIGESFAGRVAASLLNAIGLPELITSTPQAYEALAIELAINADRLANIKRKLANNRLRTALFDIQRFTRNIESAYVAMYERYQSDLPPDHVRLPQ